MIFGFNDIQALIGDGCTINVAGDFKLATTVGTNTRMIAGALSAGTAKIAVGASIASYVDEDTAVARIGTGTVGAKKTKVHAGGSADVESTGDNDALVIVVAPAVGPDSTVSVGATIAVIYMDNAIDAAITDGCEITGDAGVAVVAQNTSKLLPITVSIADSGGVAVGGTLQIIIDKTATRAHVGDDVTIKAANGPITVAALSSNEFIDVLASASVSSATKGSAAVAAVLNVIVSRSDTEATVGERSTLAAKGSYLVKGVVTPASVNVKAESEDFMVSATFALGAGKVAVGAEVNVFVFDRDVLAQVGKGSKVSAELGDVIVRANAMDYAVVVSIGASGGSNTAVSGTIPVIVSLNRVLALIGTYVDDPADTSEAKTLLDATGTSLVSTHGSVGVISDYKSDLYAAAGDE